ncbi:hypothetical protein SESBI_51253 [Sesbania bispinosa]|nr:hypothetical protein SESBI_51253 [Sesbania bispinosa]
MAGGGLAYGSKPLKRAHLYEHRFTPYFAFTCFVGALGGSLFGYDLGVSELAVFLTLLRWKNQSPVKFYLPIFMLGRHSMTM